MAGRRAHSGRWSAQRNLSGFYGGIGTGKSASELGFPRNAVHEGAPTLSSLSRHPSAQLPLNSIFDLQFGGTGYMLDVAITNLGSRPFTVCELSVPSSLPYLFAE